jgi:hypothetical protein
MNTWRVFLAALVLGVAGNAFAADYPPGGHSAQAGYVFETVLDGAPAGATDERQNVRPAACCKICRKGKACGDSCIKRTYTCTKPPGCACDG